MTDANYRTVFRCQVGEYVLDVVVEGAGGKRVAVLCDGDRRRGRRGVPRGGFPGIEFNAIYPKSGRNKPYR